MFLASIAFDPAEAPQLLQHLTHQRFAVDGACHCDIYYDSARYDISVSAQDVALLRKHVPDGEVFRLGLRPPSVMVRKPLMLGLPIYYCSTASSLIASTHIRLLAALGVKLKEEQSVLPEFFLYRYVMPPRTLFQDVFCLPLDGNVRAFVEGDSIAVGEPVWTNVFRKTTTRYGLEESATRIKEDLERTVDDLKPHGDAVGCLMSGGVDSSILYKLCKDRLSLRESHSTGYPFEAEEHNDERKYAETASAAFGSKHTYHSFRTQDFLHAVVDATYHAEIPVIAMQSALLELVFNRGLAEHLRTVLCGEGADSLFGLPIMYSYHKLRGVTRPALAPVLWLLAHTLKNRLYPWERMYAFSKRRWDLDFSNVKHGLWLTGEFADKRWVKDRYAVDEEALLKGRRAIIERFSLDNVFDAFTVLAYVSDAAIIQDIWGKLGDAQGRWICYPFNSPELIRVAHHTSWDDKMSVHKRLIRRAGQLVGVPDPILFRPKLTFGISARQWAAPGGVLEALFRVASPVVESDVLRRFLSPDEKRAMTGWTLVNYAIWKRMLIDGEPPERLHAELQGSP